MRVERDRLILLGLAVLIAARHSIRAGPVKAPPHVRLALAVLFSFSRSGEREHYDRFWRCLGAPYATAFSEPAGNVLRMNEAHSCFEWICRDVGAPGTVEYRALLNELVSGPPKHRWRRGRELQGGPDDRHT